MSRRGRAAVGQGKRYGDDARGFITALEVYEDPGFGLSRKSKAKGLRPGPKHVPDTVIVEFSKRYLAGESSLKLAKHFEISRATTYRWLKRLKLLRLRVKSPQKSAASSGKIGRQPLKLPVDFAKLAKEKTNAALIVMFGVSEPTIVRWRKCVGVTGKAKRGPKTK